jgi:hypothetical protein
MTLGFYAKAVVAVLVAVAVAIVAALADNSVNTVEWVNVAIAGVTAAAVFAAPNVPHAKLTKTVLAVLGAVLAFVATAVVDGMTTAELIQCLVIAAGALGVYAVPNAGTTGGVPVRDVP